MNEEPEPTCTAGHPAPDEALPSAARPGGRRGRFRGKVASVKRARPLGQGLMRAAMFLARLVPRWLGYPVAEWAGRLFARFAPNLRGIVESNLAAVLGEDDRRLRRTAIEVLGHAARAYYELFYLPSVAPGRIAAMLQAEGPGWSLFRQAYERGQGVILAMTHQSSFDLAGQAIAARGFPLFVIVMPDQAEGFAFLNRLRLERGIQIMPAGPRAVRAAIRALREGRVVATGGDRPIKGQGTVVEFFGRPTLLPDGTVRLALHTGAPLFVAACHREKGRYRLILEPVELARSGDTEADVRENVQRLARAMEPIIRAHPEQWHLLQQLWEG